MTRRQGLILTTQIVVLCSVISVAVATWSPADWEPIELVGLLFVLAVGSDMLTVEVKGVWISGSFVALVLAMALLGPAPAAAIGVGCTIVEMTRSRRSRDRALTNVVVYATFPVVGAVLIDLAEGHVGPGHSDALGFAGVVLLVFMATNFLNFALIAAFQKASFGVPFFKSVRSV